MAHKTLIFIPTYNESGNVESICRQILALKLESDLVFLDDNSPDGTGQILDRLAAENAQVSVIHRKGKLGIGSAHKVGIARAYECNYVRLITMDCDFTHSPADIPRLIEASEGYDLAVGSRFLEKDSLPGWNPIRKLLTQFGHLLTTILLKMPADASGAFRVYNLERIPEATFGLVEADGYAFFFESLFVLTQNGSTVSELPIVLPSRVVGRSKMSLPEIWRGVLRLLTVYCKSLISPQRFKLKEGKV